MNREVHVRFCERFGGVTPPYLLDNFETVLVVEPVYCQSVIGSSSAMTGLSSCEYKKNITISYT